VRGPYDFRLSPDDFAAPGDTYGDRVRAAAEQLGLFLRADKVSVQVTVIDHVERPTAN
jgi:uncharacterized protein (TIGR03435 family)